jgi:hypothetical protein
MGPRQSTGHAETRQPSLHWQDGTQAWQTGNEQAASRAGDRMIVRGIAIAGSFRLAYESAGRASDARAHAASIIRAPGARDPRSVTASCFRQGTRTLADLVMDY